MRRSRGLQRAEKFENDTITGVIVAEPDSTACNPTPPGAWMPVLASVAETNHVPGSADAAGYSLADSVVGWVPTVLSLIRYAVPGV